MVLQQVTSASGPASAVGSVTSASLMTSSHEALPNGSSCSLHVPRRPVTTGTGLVMVNGGRGAGSGSGSGGGRRSSSLDDDDSAVLVDHRADCDDDDAATRAALLNVRSALPPPPSFYDYLIVRPLSTVEYTSVA